MPKHIIFLCYWFPPSNSIGAKRPFQQAQYLSSIGYKVTVICGDFGDYNEDVLSNNNLTILRYSNSLLKTLWYNDEITESFTIRALKFFGRKLFYPDIFIINKKDITNIFNEITKTQGTPDLIISSGLPFSMHTIAHNISKHKNIKWLADHRDLWASSPYRKVTKSMRLIDKRYEKRILSNASFNIVIGKLMKDKLKDSINSDNIAIIRNGSDSTDVNNQYQLTKHNLIFSYTGVLYQGFRDPSPLFEALIMDKTLSKLCSIHFYGSEKDIVKEYIKDYEALNIFYHDRKPSKDIKSIQLKTHFLIIALGNSIFEKSVLTGKFYEYIESGRKIIAICDEDSELALLIANYDLGIATRNPKKILKFIQNHINNDFPLNGIPTELTRKYQNQVLAKLIEDLI